MNLEDRNLSDEMAIRIMQLLGQHEFAAEVCDFVLAAVKATNANHGAARGQILGPFPLEVCAATRDLAFFRYRDVATLTLKTWGMKDSESLGQVIHILLQVGFLIYKKDESEFNLDHYNNVFTVGDSAWTAALYEPDPRRGSCRECGYDLRGTPSRKCPECGTQH